MLISSNVALPTGRGRPLGAKDREPRFGQHSHVDISPGPTVGPHAQVSLTRYWSSRRVILTKGAPGKVNIDRIIPGAIPSKKTLTDPIEIKPFTTDG